MSNSYNITAANITLREPTDDDDTWDVQQEAINTDLNYPKNYKMIDLTYGPLKLSGYVDTDTLNLCLTPELNQLYLGIISGNVKDDVKVRVNTHCTKGDFRIYLRNGDQVWIHLNLGISFNGSYQNDIKLIQL